MRNVEWAVRNVEYLIWNCDAWVWRWVAAFQGPVVLS
jgi:hypothetical protein